MINKPHANLHPHHSQVKRRLSIRQFSWLQFIARLRLPKDNLSDILENARGILVQTCSLLQWRDRSGLWRDSFTGFSIKYSYLIQCYKVFQDFDKDTIG